MKDLSMRIAVAAACAALALPLAAVTISANGATATAACRKSPLKKAVERANGTTVRITDKVCVNGWAAATWDPRGEYAGASMLERAPDQGGIDRWRVVGPRREARLCRPSDRTAPDRVKRMACVS